MAKVKTKKAVKKEISPSPELDAPNPWLGKTCQNNFCVHNEKLICKFKREADWCGRYTP